MPNDDQLRAIHRRLRETHRKLFDLQGNAIVALRTAITAISDTHDELVALWTAVNDLEDTIDNEGN